MERDDEEALTGSIVSLAAQYGRYGYRRITALLQRAGWGVNHKRVERIWRREGLKVPQKQPKRGRLWLAGRFLCPAAAYTSQPRLSLRLRAGPDP